jgi:hypothetical protein
MARKDAAYDAGRKSGWGDYALASARSVPLLNQFWKPTPLGGYSVSFSRILYRKFAPQSVKLSEGESERWSQLAGANRLTKVEIRNRMFLRDLPLDWPDRGAPDAK